MTKRVWHTTRDGSDGWHGRFNIGRVGIGFHVYRHRYAASRVSDRWVFQPWLTYDGR